MKKKLSNIMTTTGISLVALATLALIYGAEMILVKGIFQSLLVNTLIHLGYMLFDKWEYKYPVFESVIRIGYTIAIVIVCGEIFGWFGELSEWSMAVATVIIYVCGAAVGAITTLEEVKSINILLEKQNRKKN